MISSASQTDGTHKKNHHNSMNNVLDHDTRLTRLRAGIKAIQALFYDCEPMIYCSHFTCSTCIGCTCNTYCSRKPKRSLLIAGSAR